MGMHWDVGSPTHLLNGIVTCCWVTQIKTYVTILILAVIPLAVIRYYCYPIKWISKLTLREIQ